MVEGIHRKEEWRGPQRGGSRKVLIQQNQMTTLKGRQEILETEPLLRLLTEKSALGARKLVWCGSSAIDGCG